MVFKRVDGVDLLVIACLCRQLLLAEVHEHGLATHFGAKKIASLLGSRVWWLRLHDDCHHVGKEF